MNIFISYICLDTIIYNIFYEYNKISTDRNEKIDDKKQAMQFTIFASVNILSPCNKF